MASIALMALFLIAIFVPFSSSIALDQRLSVGNELLVEAPFVLPFLVSSDEQ
jgi:hypothetical protein